jgi:HEAT repeat protein
MKRKRRKKTSDYSKVKKIVRRAKNKTTKKKLGDWEKKKVRASLALREIGRAIRESGLKDKKAIANLLDLGRQTDYYRSSQGALQALIPVKPKTIPAMVAALNHPDRFVTRDILNGLTDVDHRPSIPLYFERLAKGGVGERSNIGFALYHMHKKKPIPKLLPELMRLIQKDPSPEVRRYCARILGWSKDPQAFPVLLKRINDPAIRARDEVLCALADFKKTKFKGRLIKIFERLANDKNERIRNLAASLISNLELPGVIPSLIKLTGHQYPTDVRITATRYMASNVEKDKRSVKRLIKIVSLNNPKELRIQGIKSLQMMGDRKAIPVLIKALGKSEFQKEVGEAAVEALFQFRRERRVVDAYLNVFKQKPEFRASSAVYEALEKMLPELLKGDKAAQKKIEVLKKRLSPVPWGATRLVLFCMAYEKRTLKNIPVSEESASRAQIEYLRNLVEGIRNTTSQVDIPIAFGLIKKGGKK